MQVALDWTWPFVEEIFDPAMDKAYRHPTFYDVPEGVSHL
jgi:hypothetical protein